MMERASWRPVSGSTQRGAVVMIDAKRMALFPGGVLEAFTGINLASWASLRAPAKDVGEEAIGRSRPRRLPGEAPPPAMD